jgi:uncharacterized membrane protein
LWRRADEKRVAAECAHDPRRDVSADQHNEWGMAARRSAIARLIVAFAGGLVAGLAVSFSSPWAFSVLIGWDVAAAIFLLWVWLTIWPMDAEKTKRYANREDPSRALANGAVTTAAVACLSAVGFILVLAANASGGAKALYLGVGVLSVVLAWASVHSVFTLRYAATFYVESGGGVDFNQKAPPRYSDFAYLAFTLGMTFQVSDTDLTTETIRRLALRHALLSYLFGAVIVGLVINVVGSLLK